MAVSELDRYQELVEEKLRLSSKLADMQHEAGGQSLYSAGELAVINDPHKLQSYENAIVGFQKLLKEVEGDEEKINEFWALSVTDHNLERESVGFGASPADGTECGRTTFRGQSLSPGRAEGRGLARRPGKGCRRARPMSSLHVQARSSYQ